MRTFTMFRPNVPDATHNADQKNAPDQPQFQGVVFDDGTVAVRWMTAKRSTSVWASMEDMLAIHGHPEYGSVLRWETEAEVERLKGVLALIAVVDQGCGGNLTPMEQATSAMRQARSALEAKP